MLSSLHKSKQISFMVMDRLSDYLSLARIELQLQGRELIMQALSYSAAALFLFLMLLFFGVAMLTSFWDTPHRTLAAWSIVALYTLGAVTSINFARRHAEKLIALSFLSQEIKEDAIILRQAL
jgi:uncharacterized membrane protein YqjE